MSTYTSYLQEYKQYKKCLLTVFLVQLLQEMCPHTTYLLGYFCS